MAQIQCLAQELTYVMGAAIWKKKKKSWIWFKSFFKKFFALGPHPQHMEVPRLGVESALQLVAYTTATATPDP